MRKMTHGKRSSSGKTSSQCLTVDKSQCFRLESNEQMMRLDENILPTKWRGATVSEDEMQKLRKVKNVIRRGRISSIEETNIMFESGEEMNLPEGTLIVDCARNSTKWPQNKKVFDGDTINLQYLMLPPLGLGFCFCHI